MFDVAIVGFKCSLNGGYDSVSACRHPSVLALIVCVSEGGQRVSWFHQNRYGCVASTLQVAKQNQKRGKKRTMNHHKQLERKKTNATSFPSLFPSPEACFRCVFATRNQEVIDNLGCKKLKMARWPRWPSEQVRNRNAKTQSSKQAHPPHCRSPGRNSKLETCEFPAQHVTTCDNLSKLKAMQSDHSALSEQIDGEAKDTKRGQLWGCAPKRGYSPAERDRPRYEGSLEHFATAFVE